MTSVNSISQSLLDTVNGSESTQSTAEETEDRFLTLLVEQMKNQDPLNPMENAQVTSQMAQLSTVTGIDTLNETMTAMIGNMQASQSYQAANMIGHGVLVPGDTVEVTDEGGIFGYEADTDANTVTIEITDSSGDVVKTITQSDVEEGINAVQWDGVMDDGEQAPEGYYEISVTGTIGEEDVTVSPLAIATVNSVSVDTSGVTLNLSNLESISTDDVKEIF